MRSVFCCKEMRLQRPYRLYRFLSCRRGHGEERSHGGCDQRDAKEYGERRSAENEDRSVNCIGKFGVEHSAPEDTSGNAQRETDERDNERFGEEDFENVRAPRAHGA